MAIISLLQNTLAPAACPPFSHVAAFAGLGGLVGDVGAKKLLAMTKVPIVEISLPQAAVDIDHVEDLPTQ